MNFSKPPPNFSQPVRPTGPRTSVNLNPAKTCLSGHQGPSSLKQRFPGPHLFNGGSRVFRPSQAGPSASAGGSNFVPGGPNISNGSSNAAGAPTFLPGVPGGLHLVRGPLQIPRPPVQANPQLIPTRGPPVYSNQFLVRPNPSAHQPAPPYLHGGYGDHANIAKPYVSVPQPVQTLILPPGQVQGPPHHIPVHLVHHPQQSGDIVMQPGNQSQMMGVHQGGPYPPQAPTGQHFLEASRLPVPSGFPAPAQAPLHGCVLLQQPDPVYQAQQPSQALNQWTTHTTSSLPPSSLSANPPQCVPFPPPNFSQPPPPLNPQIVSPTNPRPLISPRYETPPKTPVSSCSTSVPMFLSPPPPFSHPMVPVYPLTPGPPSAAPSPSLPASSDEIPDLRHQFLNNQFLPQPGQVVLLPPLPPERSVQTIQLLTPGSSGQFQVQTIVLPIIKMEQGVHQTAEQPGWAVDQSTVVQQQSGAGHQALQASVAQQPSVVQHSPVVQDTNMVSLKKESLVESDLDKEEGILLNQVDDTGLPAIMQGVDLEQVKRFASEFKSARLQLGLTQTQVGQALTGASEEQAVSQSTICRFEKLEITAMQVKKLLPQLQRWLAEVQERQAAGLPIFESVEVTAARENKKRKKRTVFNQETVEVLTKEFTVCSSPSSQVIAELADRLGLEKETVRVWFCNKRQQNKKTQQT